MAPRGEATLGVAMIMKDEAANLPRSLAPLAPLVDEVVAVDTGSADGSQRLAKDMGARVLDFAWNDDFSAARNFGLAHATTDFILWLDADNGLAPQGLAELRRHLAPGRLVALWATEEVVPQGDRLWQKRVFPNHPSARFSGTIHEQLVTPPGWPNVATRAVITHWGYDSPARARAKGERNLRLLLASPELARGEFYWLYQAGRTLLNLRRPGEAAAYLARAAEARPDSLSLKGHALILLSQALTRLGRAAEAETALRRLVAEAPAYGPGLFYLGKFLYKKGGRAAEAAALLGEALKLGTGDLAWGADAAKNDGAAAYMLERLAAKGVE